MKNQVNKKNDKSLILLVVLLLLIIGVTVGYAVFNATLKVTGNSTIDKVNWDIHFENLKVTDGSVKAEVPAKIDDNKTNIDYTVTLSKPGDYYEFTLDIKNDGTIPAKIAAEPTLAGLSTAQDVYTNYTVTYKDGSEVKANDALLVGESKTLKIRVEYDTNITVEQLPTEPQKSELTFAINFVQK